MTFIIVVLVSTLALGGIYLAIFTAQMFALAVSEPDPEERTKWVFAVKFFGPIGAFLYYRARRR